ncbi:unnamed protein product [Peronospora belbahrii]|uniref:Aminotransferase class I/classII large domain-containing protein n=1 Tax=Peronospora belbahrii TaxID=622444 RepID=A0ABN8D610_9STRA|nr:unnamed protein product [Peronospora belbahrii]
MARFTPKQDPAMLQYGYAKGFAGFREAIAKFVADATFTKEIDPETVMVTAEPTYFLAHNIFRELSLDLKGMHTGKDGIDLDALEVTLASAMFRHQCKRLVVLVQKYGFRIISDEPYNLLHLNGGGLPSLSSFDDSGLVVSLGSFSKILAPGLRLGWAQSSRETIEKLSTIGKLVVAAVRILSLRRSFIPCWSRTFCYLTLTFKSVLRARKTVMCSSLRKHCSNVVFVEPFGGYFVWLQLPEGVHTALLLKIAESRHGVAFTPGTRCSLGTLHDNDGGDDAMTQYARLSFAF